MCGFAVLYSIVHALLAKSHFFCAGYAAQGQSHCKRAGKKQNKTPMRYYSLFAAGIHVYTVNFAQSLQIRFAIRLQKRYNK